MNKHSADSESARRDGEQEALHVRNAVVYVLGANVVMAVICLAAVAWLFR